MNLVDATRYLNIVLYGALFLVAVAVAIRTRGRARFVSAVWVAFTALAWAAFYSAIAAGFWDVTNDADRADLTVVSRVMHLFTVGALGTYLSFIVLEARSAEKRARDRAAAGAKVEELTEALREELS